MYVNVFLIVTRFLVLIWAIVEVDVCVSVYERPVRLKMVLKYSMYPYDTFTFWVIRGRDQLRHSKCARHAILRFRAQIGGIIHTNDKRTNIVHYSLYKLLRYTYKSIDTAYLVETESQHTQTVQLLMSFLENQFLIPSAEKVLRCILGASRLLFGPRGMASLETSSQLFAFFNNPEP